MVGHSCMDVEKENPHKTAVNSILRWRMIISGHLKSGHMFACQDLWLEYQGSCMWTGHVTYCQLHIIMPHHVLYYW